MCVCVYIYIYNLDDFDYIGLVPYFYDYNIFEIYTFIEIGELKAE